MITQSAFDFTTRAVCMYMCQCVCMPGKARERGGKVPDTGCATDMCGQKQAHLYTGRRAGSRRHKHYHAHDRAEQKQHAHKHTQIFPLRLPPLCGLSLLALSCFPDSKWRSDRRAEWLEVRLCDDRPRPLSVTSTLPACCLKINWQIETQNCCLYCLTPCLFTYFFFFPFNPSFTDCRSFLGLM